MLNNTLASEVLEHLAAVGVQARWVAGTSRAGDEDPVLEVATGAESGAVAFDVVVGPPSIARPDLPVPGSATHRPRLLLADYVDGRDADALRARGWSWVDRAGNTSLRAPGIVVEVSGRTRPKRESTPALFSKAAMPVVFAILSKPDLLGGSVRDVREHAGVSLGTVHNTLRALRELGLSSPITDPYPSDVLVTRWRMVAEGWLSTYLGRYRASRSLGTFLASERPASLVGVASGELAAEAMGLGIRPIAYDFWVADDERGQLIVEDRLHPDPTGPISLRRTFWSHLLDPEWEQFARRVAPPLLVYADLLAVQDPRLDVIAREVQEFDPVLRLLA